MDLTMCGLLVDRAAELAALYRDLGNWNDVRETWYDERLSNRSTRGSARKVFRVLTSRFKNAPAALPNPSTLPAILADCKTRRDRAQVLYWYLVADDPLVRYVVHEYANRLAAGATQLDFSNETLVAILDAFEYADGSAFDYADSTTRRWCEGFRAVMREIGVLDGQQAVVGEPPSVGDVPLLVAVGYSYEAGGEDWVDAPTGLLYLFQPPSRWEEHYDRAASTDAWAFVELHGELRLQPTDGSYGWVDAGGGA